MTERIVSVPIGAAEFIGKTTGHLTHAAAIDESGAILRVLCKRVKAEHLLEDAALYDLRPVDCPQCKRLMRAPGS